MRPRSVGFSVLGALGIAALVAGSASAGSDTTTLANGAELTATIDTPTIGDTFLTTDPAVDVPIEGSASIGEGEPNVHWTYVIDVSGSADFTACGIGSLNVLECEKQAVLNLNAEVVGDASAKDVAVTVFGSSAATADMKPDGGDQLLQDVPGSPEFATVVNSVGYRNSDNQGFVGQYTTKTVGASTNFTAALNAALTSVNASTAISKNVVFLSDGQATTPPAFDTAVQALDTAGATIYSFAVGSNNTCLTGQQGLQKMADGTGGTCTNVTNPADLPDIVVNVTATEMTAVSLTVDGNGVGFDSNSNPPPFDGPGSTDVTATAANQAPGTHEACLTAAGTGPKSDASSLDTAEVCETYKVYGFDLNPETATNELSEDQDHTVTATLTGDDLAGFDVDFEVISGPNTGETGEGTTDANGEVEFTYTNPNVDPSGLGTDTIEATVDVNGDTAPLTVTKEWVDTIAPVSSCDPSVNPNGKKQPQAPGNGGQGQNQDGFYVIGASDNIWPDDTLEVFVTDTGSGTVFGPYAVGTNIKYTEAPGAMPKVKTIGGPNSAVDWHIIGNGDADVTAVDGSGNISPGVACLVPPAPK